MGISRLAGLRSHMYLVSLICLLGLEEPCAAQSRDDNEPLNLGSRLELFVDDYLIESLTGVALKLHSPVAAGKVITFDKPWEGATSAQALVFEDEGLFRMYYRGTSHAGYSVPSLLKPGEAIVPQHVPVACYAESRDGIHWSRPSLGLFDFQGSSDNNIVWMGEGASNFAPFRDTHPAVTPTQQYKAITRVRREGKPVLIALISEDGIHWRRMQEDPIITDGAFDSLNVAFWDTWPRKDPSSSGRYFWPLVEISSTAGRSTVQ